MSSWLVWSLGLCVLHCLPQPPLHGLLYSLCCPYLLSHPTCPSLWPGVSLFLITSDSVVLGICSLCRPSLVLFAFPLMDTWCHYYLSCEPYLVWPCYRGARRVVCVVHPLTHVSHFFMVWGKDRGGTWKAEWEALKQLFFFKNKTY